MTVDKEILAVRIAKIREELRHLERLDGMSLEAFLSSRVEQHAVERELQIVIEACLDVGHHVISREGLRRPNDYREVFQILTEAGILDAALGRRLEDMASFRNRLVHGYLELDPAQVFQIGRGEPRDVEAFVQAVVTRFGLARPEG